MRQTLFNGLHDAAQAVRSQLQPALPGDRATEALQLALLPAATETLTRHVDALVCGSTVAGTPSNSAFRDAICETLVGPVNTETTGARHQLMSQLHRSTEDLHQSIGQATDSDLSAIERSIQSVVAPMSETAAAFAAIVQQVRQTYGSRGPQALRLPTDIACQVQGLTHDLAPGIAEAIQQFGLTRVDHEADFIGTLRKAAIVLVDHGIDTPLTLHRFLTAARAHDNQVIFTTGCLGQAGYGIGMGAFMYGVAPKIAPMLLGEIGGMGGAVAFGAVAGAMVGYLDCIASSGAGALEQALVYEGSAPTTGPAAGWVQRSEAADIGTRMGIAAAATFTKNALLRAVVPSIVYAAAFPAGVPRDLRDGLDLAGDAGGGLVSGGIAAVLTRRALGRAPTRDFKLLSQGNLPQIIQRHHGPTRGAVGVHALVDYAKGLGTGAIAPSTLAVTGAVVAPLVGVLLGINVGLVPGLGLSAPLAGATPAPVQAAEHALKATISTLLMSVLSAGATGVGQYVGRHADADVLAAVLGAVWRAARQLGR